jgi:hypothetical protein
MKQEWEKFSGLLDLMALKSGNSGRRFAILAAWYYDSFSYILHFGLCF